jgi:hypothetical protein
MVPGGGSRQFSGLHSTETNCAMQRPTMSGVISTVRQPIKSPDFNRSPNTLESFANPHRTGCPAGFVKTPRLFRHSRQGHGRFACAASRVRLCTFDSEAPDI